ncbi:MAG: DUF721 domain-containing protein [Myxococcales bacterium]|nr:DUF721 domain-containing protein [Myxococcales bacterium]
MARRSKQYEPIGVAHIGTLLAEAIRDPARIRAALGVWPAWEEAVGPQVAQAARPVSLRTGVLTVHVKNTVWMQELYQQRQSLLRKVQALPAGSAVHELRFRVAPVPTVEQLSGAEPREPVRPAPIPYEVAKQIRTVPNPALRGVMLRVASRWAGLVRAREGED